jgi:hypothetical protein
VIRDAAQIGRIAIPDLTSEPLQYRAIFALFALTSLLSSFPIVKEIDVMILSYLHRLAFIPDDVRLFATKLCNASFIAPPEVTGAVRATLTMRDTTRVADHLATGVLEQKIIDILCLRARLDAAMVEDKYDGFKIKLVQDLTAINTQAQELRSKVTIYLRDQERIIPDSCIDMDSYIFNNTNKPEVAELFSRRQELQLKCDTLYEIICLVVALSVFGTSRSHEDIDKAVAKIGFATKVDEIPILDWDTVGVVTLSTFIMLLFFNGIYSIVGYIFNLFVIYPEVSPDRASILRFSVLFTLGYAIVIWLAVRLKRSWRLKGIADNRPENLLIGIFCYLATVWINVIISLYIRHELTYAPFLYGLNQAILGYFVGLYIDRSQSKQLLSVKFALLQAAAQATVAIIATTYSPNIFSSSVSPSVEISIFQISLFIGVFSMVQSAISGFIVSIMFQYFYRQRPTTTNGPTEKCDRLSPALSGNSATPTIASQTARTVTASDRTAHV